MTESDWNNSTDVAAMLQFLGGRGLLSDRKARLFACACVRRVWHLLGDERSRGAVEVAERYADNSASRGERDGAMREAGTADTALLYAEPEPVDEVPFLVACAATWSATDNPGYVEF